MKQSLRKTYSAILYFLLVFGLVFLFFGGYYCFKASSTSSWPFVEGKILDSYIQESKSDGKTKYRAKIKYSYMVDGQGFTGNRVSYGTISIKSYVNEIVETYPVGRIVEVYYNPNDYSESVLSPGVNFIVILSPIVGMAFIILSSVLLMFRDQMMGVSEKILGKFRSSKINKEK